MVRQQGKVQNPNSPLAQHPAPCKLTESPQKKPPLLSENGVPADPGRFPGRCSATLLSLPDLKQPLCRERPLFPLRPAPLAAHTHPWKGATAPWLHSGEFPGSSRPGIKAREGKGAASRLLHLLRRQHHHEPAPPSPPPPGRRRSMPGCAAGRRAALPLRADRVRDDPTAAPGPPGVPRRGAALRRARGHSHDEAGTDDLSGPHRSLGQAPGHQDPPQFSQQAVSEGRNTSE